MKNRISIAIFCIYIAVEFYVLGGGMVNSFVGYRTWRFVGSAEFVQFHKEDAANIIPVFVIFFFLSFIPQTLLFWFRPNMIPQRMVWAALIINSVVLVSTVTTQIPIQMELSKGLSLPLIEQLIKTDLIFRRIPMALLAIINFVMLYMVVRKVSGTTKS